MDEDREVPFPYRPELCVEGHACIVWDDDTRARKLHSERHLMAAPFDARLLVDRFDVRTLMDAADVSKRSPHKRVRWTQDDLEEEERLDAERYRDAVVDVEDDAEKEVMHGGRTATQGDNLSAVPFNYAEGVDDHEKDPPVSKQRSFQPPFHIPESIAVWPETQKQHQIIEQTACFVLRRGRLAEEKLKIRQGRNPNFAFLFPTHPMRPYYEHVLRLKSAEAVTARSEGLQLLAQYGENDEHEDELEQSFETDDGPSPPPPPPHSTSLPPPPPPPPLPSSSSVPLVAPPPDPLRTIIEKTARFVTQSHDGPELEAKMRDMECKNPHFAFLWPWNPSFAYYNQCKEQNRTGQPTSQEDEKEKQSRRRNKARALLQRVKQSSDD